MTIFDVLKFNRELLIRIRKSGIRLEDADYIDLFVDFNNMVANGDKVSYAVACLNPLPCHRLSDFRAEGLLADQAVPK